MGDIITYLEEYGGYSFAEKPFCAVDGLVMAHFSYYVFEDIVPDSFGRERAVRLLEMENRMNPEHFTSVTWESERNRELFHRIVNSRRFRSTQACCYVNEIDMNKEMQFSAITLLLGNGDIFIAFRGTDDALVGWKEDFYMSCRTPVASQERSRQYFENVARLLRRKRHARFYLGGHSKGGNLAVYAAMTCNESLRRKIGAVYNYDGPGFRPDFLQTLDYEGIRDKVFKFIPKESFVGMLMQENENYILIESTNVGLLQHIPLSWCIKGDDFVRVAEQEPQRKKLYGRMNEWLLSMDKEQIGSFLESLFKLFEVTQAQTLTELTTDALKNSINIWNAYKDMDSETKGILWELCVFLVQLAARDHQERIRSWKLLDRLRCMIEADYGK